MAAAIKRAVLDAHTVVNLVPLLEATAECEIVCSTVGGSTSIG